MHEQNSRHCIILHVHNIQAHVHVDIDLCTCTYLQVPFTPPPSLLLACSPPRPHLHHGLVPAAVPLLHGPEDVRVKLHPHQVTGRDEVWVGRGEGGTCSRQRDRGGDRVATGWRLDTPACTVVRTAYMYINVHVYVECVFITTRG